MNVFLCSERLPGDGHPVPKHVDQYVTNFILLSASVGCCINYRNTHSTNNIKFVKNVWRKVETSIEYSIFCVGYEIVFRLPGKCPGRF
jgi:hypothetical protein